MGSATIVRAHACAAGYVKNSQQEQALGRSKEGFTTKNHALVDDVRESVEVYPHRGSTNEITPKPLLGEARQDALFIADQGYDSKPFVTALDKGGTPVIPARKNQKNPRPYPKPWNQNAISSNASSGP